MEREEEETAIDEKQIVAKRRREVVSKNAERTRSRMRDSEIARKETQRHTNEAVCRRAVDQKKT